MTPDWKLSNRNREKYLKPPTVKQIVEFIDSLDISVSQFERFYGLPSNHIHKVIGGQRNLAAYAWHIIYEKVKPKYGAGFLHEINEKAKIEEKLKISKEIKKQAIETEKKVVSIDYHNRLNDLL